MLSCARSGSTASWRDGPAKFPIGSLKMLDYRLRTRNDLVSTFRQREANRINALRSTGPRTTEGKERSRNNARRHGLAARVGSIRSEQLRMDHVAKSLAKGSN